MSTKMDLAKIMAKVIALLAKADSTEFPEEAATFRAGAERLMREYRIAEEDLIATDQEEIAPEIHQFWLGPVRDQTRGGGGKLSSAGNSFYSEWYGLASAAAEHAGARIHYTWGDNPETGEYGLIAVIVGYGGDLRLAEMIYTSARLVFGERIEPKSDPTLSDQVNAYRLRSAGITRDRAAVLIWGETSAARAAMVGKLYKAECALREEKPVLDGRGTNAALYRDVFAASFVQEFKRRLRAARDAADSTGGALVLHGRDERIAEAFYNYFPSLRPKPRETDAVATRETAPARKRREAKPYWETAAYRREQDRMSSDVAQAARGAGRSAAADVELNRASNAKRINESAPGAAKALEG